MIGRGGWGADGGGWGRTDTAAQTPLSSMHVMKHGLALIDVFLVQVI